MLTKLQAKSITANLHVWIGGDLMAITLDGTNGITTPDVDSTTSVTTPLVTNAGTLALSATGANVVTASTNGVERLRITSAGNVGIGASSPNSKLTVYGGETQWGDTSGLGVLSYTGGAPIVGSVGAIPLLFYTNSAERARIDASGNLLVGKTSAGSILDNGNELTPSYAMFSASNTGTDPTVYIGANGAAQHLVQFYYGATFVGSITTSGTNTAYNTSSDYRLKEDVQPMVGASDRLMALKPVNFAWKTDGTRVDGFLAHEAQEVVPECVTGEKDAVDDEGKPQYQGIDQSKIVPLLVAALQEALTKIEALEARVAALETNA
jgi:hypothetical protein